jgi:hypothetical protein
MNSTPVVASTPAVTTLVAAAAAAVISASLIGGVATLFLRGGTAFAQTSFAERTCAAQPATELRHCSSALLATSNNPGVAGR